MKKSGFTDAQLATIFNLLSPYRTVPSPIPAKENPPMRIEWYWCLLCLAFTGARRAEIAQLLRSDVREIDGVWCFSLEESEEGEGEETKKALKNAPSKRIVPLHSQLIEAGFLKWLEQQPGEGRVFPLLCDAGFGKITLWFSYFLLKNGLKVPALSLHSFRHTLTVKLELARTHPSLMRRLLGHSLGNDVESRVYLGSLTYDVKELQTALEAVKFPVC